MTGLTAKQMVYEAKIFYEDIASNNAPSFTDREWSVILTNAQFQIVTQTYRQGWDNNEENRLTVQNLLRTKNVDSFSKGTLENSYVISFPSDLMYLTYEDCDGKQVRILSHDAYFTNIFNPFKKPSDSVVWRLVGAQGSNMLISTTEPNLYKYIYIERPWPIIVSDLQESQALEIREKVVLEQEVPPSGIEKSTSSEESTVLVKIHKQADCKLHPNVHRKIAQTAAKIAYASTQEQAGYQIQELESNKV